ncbi:single-stranded DNA-binding protein [Listeria booriae]|uniref:Single-stranded DNA-binding protein n=1 Tax=Listeria booriae TaxID=1552123 RepID=A0A841XVQ7_9LIST|nr:single-stranded DNA-binding protein [Listeria booriae]MBC1371331.1 single-stranded DNA-binding protein [Listeria booriae]MBC2676727.1 single-stranded DNA-binding protein [Listeria booriae]
MNQVVMVGRLTKGPEQFYIGVAIATFVVAVEQEVIEYFEEQKEESIHRVIWVKPTI